MSMTNTQITYFQARPFHSCDTFAACWSGVEPALKNETNMKKLKCSKCQIEIPEDRFPRNRSRKTGRMPYCKPCYRIIRKKRYAANPQKFRDKVKKYFRTNPSSVKARRKLYVENNQDKILARQAVRNALRSNLLIKEPCQVWQVTESVEAHHESYLEEDRLKVEWLCTLHHRERHHSNA